MYNILEYQVNVKFIKMDIIVLVHIPIFAAKDK